MNRLAIVRIADGRVVTFVRADLPPGFAPPEGCRLVRESDLPAGWQMVNALRPVPAEISAVQARHWMIRAGIYPEAVDNAIAGIADAIERELVKAWWEYEPILRRDASAVERFRVAMGMTAEQIDDAFREAAEIVA